MDQQRPLTAALLRQHLLCRSTSSRRGGAAAPLNRRDAGTCWASAAHSLFLPSSFRWIRSRGDGCVCGVPPLQQHVRAYKYVCVGGVCAVGPFRASEFHSGYSRLFSLLACLCSRGGEEHSDSGNTSDTSVGSRAERPRKVQESREHRRTARKTIAHRKQQQQQHGGSQHTRTERERERDMHAEIHHSATPFKVLPKQSASDTVIRHTLPVDRRGNDADTKGIICTNVGGTNSQHSHTTLALSVHPTPRHKRPRQAPINKIMRRWRQIPCRHFRVSQQRHQQERAALCLPQCSTLCSWPLGALNVSPTISSSKKKPHADGIHFIRKWRCRAEPWANNPQHIIQSFFPLPHKKKTKML
ncbi:hypothetical protein TCDM_09012 [Trypanosoma cruzi Dm28c]|uniref:Uncharacterized protein n=1 Tax=Trypanosoma cruzi Dm28c TaxID=1416333 RepID=V5D703_TRYCR|nr:hypothetical protein TCDM_09012 [Trypanosoma cruzi Dm28c]